MYYSKNRAKFKLKVYIILVTKYRKKLLNNNISEELKSCIAALCSRYNYHLIIQETDQDHIHILLEYLPSENVANIVKRIKQNTAHHLRQKYPELSNYYYKKNILWSDGYFACSIGYAQQKRYENILKTKDSRFLPPPKGSGFPRLYLL